LALIGLGAIFVLALGLVAQLVRPLGAPPLAFDSQFGVVHFEHIASGQLLDAQRPTPKPALTLIYGSLHAISDGWRLITLAAILAYSAAIVLTAMLGWRLGGPVAAGFAAVAVMMSPLLVHDAAAARGVPWALLGWLAAGLLLTFGPPRYLAAGLVLAVATLVRIETLVLTAVTIAALVSASLVGWRWPHLGRPPRRAWLVPTCALLAIPILLLHDLRLTGDPLFWTKVAQRFTEATRRDILTPPQVVDLLADRVWDRGALVLLALVGLARLIHDRAWPIVVGLIGLGPGVAVFLLATAARGIFIEERYVAAVDLAVAFGAAIGAATFSLTILRSVTDTPPPWPAVRSALVAGLAALLIAGPYWIADPTIEPTVRRAQRLMTDTARAIRVLDADLEATGGLAGRFGPLVLAPTPVRPRISVDLGVPIRQVQSTQNRRIDLVGGYPAAGQYVLHSRVADQPHPSWRVLETSVPIRVGDVVVVPLLAVPKRGLWVLRIDPAVPGP
jgi:hypothetical protein